MGQFTLADVAEKMRDIDFCMLTTVTEGAKLSSRPMSNNRDVDYDGDSWFFAYDDARFIQDVQANDQVGHLYRSRRQGQPDTRSDRFRGPWVDDMERWFPQGIETPGLVLLKVHASLLHYWDGEDEGEVKL